ncbi:MAG: hypothetical protein ACJ719_06830 [Nitrososphaeraceae archaeon]
MSSKTNVNNDNSNDNKMSQLLNNSALILRHTRKMAKPLEHQFGLL